MDYAVSEKRNKRKDKAKDKRKHPYKSGGKFRSSEVKIDNEGTSGKAGKKFKKKNKK